MTVLPLGMDVDSPFTGSQTASRLVRACHRATVDRPPVWMMRQAGRYLPEYRAVRAKHDFLTMVRTPELAAEVTLQPVDLLHVDAAIIFSDILVVPHAMGMSLRVDEGVGPRFDAPISSRADIARLRDYHADAELGYTMDAIRLVRRELGEGVPVIGFAGAPFTLAAYMIDGGGAPGFPRTMALLKENRPLVLSLLDRLATHVGEYLCAQVRAGASVVQLFESSAGALLPGEYRAIALPALAKAAHVARTAGAPLIVFPHGASWALEEVAIATGADVIGADWRITAAEARRVADRLDIAVQGNLDPALLMTTPERIRQETQQMLRDFAGVGYIANLGHGITPKVPVENARAFIDTVLDWRADL